MDESKRIGKMGKIDERKKIRKKRCLEKKKR